jgi:hypothetical protein
MPITDKIDDLKTYPKRRGDKQFRDQLERMDRALAKQASAHDIPAPQGIDRSWELWPVERPSFSKAIFRH